MTAPTSTEGQAPTDGGSGAFAAGALRKDEYSEGYGLRMRAVVRRESATWLETKPSKRSNGGVSASERASDRGAATRSGAAL